jgi:hypothetical protein
VVFRLNKPVGIQVLPIVKDKKTRDYRDSVTIVRSFFETTILAVGQLGILALYTDIDCKRWFFDVSQSIYPTYNPTSK